MQKKKKKKDWNVNRMIKDDEMFIAFTPLKGDVLDMVWFYNNSKEDNIFLHKLKVKDKY